MTYEYMTGDQRFAARRTDVLVYPTDPLAEDATFAGPVTASLYVFTTGTDSDWLESSPRKSRKAWCGGRESNPHSPCGPRDFKCYACVCKLMQRKHVNFIHCESV